MNETLKHITRGAVLISLPVFVACSDRASNSARTPHNTETPAAEKTLTLAEKIKSEKDLVLQAAKEQGQGVVFVILNTGIAPTKNMRLRIEKLAIISGEKYVTNEGETPDLEKYKREDGLTYVGFFTRTCEGQYLLSISLNGTDYAYLPVNAENEPTNDKFSLDPTTCSIDLFADISAQRPPKTTT